jgi:hypothetical protein
MADFDTWKIIDNFTDCNNQYLIMNAFYRIMTAMMIAGVTFASCEGQDPEHEDTEQTPNEPPEDNNGQNPDDNPEQNIPAGEEGEMTFDIETPGQVTVEGPLEMTIVQTSSYTDPDGTVYECAPKATISVTALKDTIYVTDISQLIAVGEASLPETDKEGKSPVTHTISQEFQVGGQTVDFDLAYEVYTYVNSRKQNVEMPYVKLSPAELGSADAMDTKGSADVKLSDITVRPIAPETRSITVSESTAYEVTVRFNLEAETANLAETSKQTIPFEVVYVGVVTQTSTYPGAQHTYELKDGDGNNLSGTDFTVEPGRSFQLNLIQHSSYTDQNGAETAAPEAWTRITSPGTLCIEKADDLIEMLDEVLIEVKSERLDGKLPYYILEDVVLDGEVTITEVSAGVETYKATAIYKQKAIPVNMENGDEIEFVYVVEYLGQIVNNGAELSYKLVNGVGETVDGTSFTVEPNSQFDLFIEQSSSYMVGEEVISQTPLAWVMITSPDLTVVEKAEDLEDEIDRISFDIWYEKADDMMPYYRLTEIVPDGDVEIEEMSSEHNDRIKIYKATATYKLSAVPVNIAGLEDIDFTFAVEYLGKVITSGEDYTYQITDGNGNPIGETVFNIGPNSSLELNFKQNYLHVYDDGTVEEMSPLAYTKIASPNVMRIENADDLITKLSVITMETKSEELEGNRPYYKFGDFVLDGEILISEDTSHNEEMATFYKAIATYKQKASPVNIDGGQEYEFTYIVTYLGRIDAAPIDVEYTQEVIWEDAHDNIYTNSQIVVTRRAKYSDGTLEETKFYSTKNYIMSVASNETKDNSGEIEYTTYARSKGVDSTIATCATGVPDFEHLVYEASGGDKLYNELSAYKGPVGIWTEYKHQETAELYNESVQTEGVYGKQFGYRSRVTLEYINDNLYYALRVYKIDLIYKDRFFCIDGKLFTVDPLEHTHRWSVETIETPDRGTCKLHKLESDVTWLGRDFYYAVVDTVYVKQPTVAPAASAHGEPTAVQRSQVKRRTPGAPYAAQEPGEPAMSLSVQTVPGSEPYTERTIIRPDGTRTTRRYDGIVTEFER